MPDATDAAIKNAARTAGADDFIEAQKSGYDTAVGERGLKLSGGQKQRLSIARAILKNSPIFIFDEATSAVDNETEEAIQHSLAAIVKNRTTIIIAHRLSTIRHADAIYVLDHGAIAEAGHHDDLQQRGGIYTKLWQIQTGAIYNHN
jgi:ATP-binding cassette subfamily B protein